MKLIVPITLRKTEFLLSEKTFSLEAIKQAARKALGGIGETIMSIKNARFKKALEKNLDVLLKDLVHKKFEEYPL